MIKKSVQFKTLKLIVMELFFRKKNPRTRNSMLTQKQHYIYMFHRMEVLPCGTHEEFKSLSVPRHKVWRASTQCASIQSNRLRNYETRTIVVSELSFAVEINNKQVAVVCCCSARLVGDKWTKINCWTNTEPCTSPEPNERIYLCKDIAYYVLSTNTLKCTDKNI